MRAVLSAALLAGALLFVPAAAGAAPIKYQVNFGATATDPDGGIGFFFRDNVTGLLSDFTWDFGGGNTGGIDDSSVNWNAPVFGGNLSGFLFEILTFQDVHPTPCSTLLTGCSQGFGAAQLFGFPESITFSDAVETNAQTYKVNQGPSGSFSTELAPTELPEPGVLALLALGMCGARAFARRRDV